MLDIRQIRENADAVNAALKRRNSGLSVNAILALDVERRGLLQEEETLRSERNALTKQVADAKRDKNPDADSLLAQSKGVSERIKAIEVEKDALAAQQEALLLNLPNIPALETPDGQNSEDNPVVRVWGDEFKARVPEDVVPHWEIGTHLGLLDFERGVKVAKSRFTVMRGLGARLERALIQFMLDLHTTRHGYEEILPPFLVNRQAMQGTGQLPKFEDDMFKVQDELFLIPTAEVPVTNLYADELLLASDLPKYFTAYTPCFRREAGSAGQDTRGLIRQHQFNKVELVKVVHPEESAQELEQLVRHAESVLQALQLPYRVVALCAGDLGFSAQQCYDLEVWMPAQGVYREISSCSNMGDFQARRMTLKFRHPETGKPTLAHTLNGSALAVGRTVAAILENYQLSPTEFAIPEVLKPYLENRLVPLLL